MPADPDDRLAEDDRIQELCRRLGEWASEHGYGIATAESLTSGNLAANLGRADGSSDWFCGGIVAYRKSVKYQLLQVPDGPVVSPECARAMAQSAAELLGADIALAVTGEAGPKPQEDVPPGTVWFGIYDRGELRAEHRRFDGEPDDVLAATISVALDLLLALAD